MACAGMCVRARARVNVPSADVSTARFSAACWLLHPSWHMCVYKRMFESENKVLSKEGVLHFLELFEAKRLPFAPEVSEVTPPAPPPPRAPLSRARGQGACRLARDPQRVGGLGGSGSRPAASRSAHPSPPGSAVACGQGSRLWPSPSCPRHSLRRCLNGEARGVRTGVEASRRPAGRVVRVRVSPARAQRSPPRSRVAAVTHSM